MALSTDSVKDDRSSEDASPVESLRMVTGSEDFTLILWKPHGGDKPVARMTGHQALVNCVAFSPNALFIASASFDKSIKLWSGATGQ